MLKRAEALRPAAGRAIATAATATAAVIAVIAALGAIAWAHGGKDEAEAAKPAQLTAAPAIADVLTVPGSATPLPWPHTGQTGLVIQDIGDLGRAGNTTPRPIASVAKIMTAYLVLRHHPIGPRDAGPAITIATAEAAAYPRERALGQSAIPVRAGEQLTERQALEALMLPSANNIARILARWDAGTVPAFLTAMNATATALGMSHTRYTDPSGWDAGTVSTVEDQLRLAEIAMTISTFAAIVRMPTSKLPVVGEVRNVNGLLGRSGVIGVKTGSMNAAGGCLVFAAVTDIAGQRVRILGAVLGQTDLGAAFGRAQTLIAAARRLIRPYTLIRAGQVVAIGSDGTALIAAADLRVLGWPGMRFQTALNLRLGTRTTPGATVGTLSLVSSGTPTRTDVRVASGR